MPLVAWFCPVPSNFTPSQGMISCAWVRLVAASASRIFAGSVEPARLIASASTMVAVNARAGVPSMSLP
jgi:hypothetical protein